MRMNAQPPTTTTTNGFPQFQLQPMGQINAFIPKLPTIPSLPNLSSLPSITSNVQSSQQTVLVPIGNMNGSIILNTNTARPAINYNQSHGISYQPRFCPNNNNNYKQFQPLPPSTVILHQQQQQQRKQQHKQHVQKQPQQSYNVKNNNNNQQKLFLFQQTPSICNLFDNKSNKSNKSNHRAKISNYKPQNIPRFITKTENKIKNEHKAKFGYLKFKQDDSDNTFAGNRNISNVIFCDILESEIEEEDCTNGRYHKCDKCDKKYKYLCNLRSHSKVHTNEAHVCEYCQKRFGRKANYQEHRRVHTGESPYSCNICKKSFKQRHGLKDHMRLRCVHVLK